MMQNKVSMELSGQIQSFLRRNGGKRNRQQKHLHWGDVAVFAQLPGKLQERLRGEVFTNRLMSHPMLHALAQVSEVALRSMICDGLSELTIAADEEMFAAGEPASLMYFVLSGRCHYLLGVWRDDPHREPRVPDLSVGGGHTACEIALWNAWVHQGCLLAAATCEALTLSAASFHSAVKDTPSFAPCAEYGAAYAQAANNACLEGLAHVLDLGLDLTEVASFTHDAFDTLMKRTVFGAVKSNRPNLLTMMHISTRRASWERTRSPT